MSEIEQAVRKLDKLRREAADLDGYLRDMRLGAKHEFAPRKIRWRDMVIAYGWSHRKAEPLPDGMETEFYTFISAKLDRLGEKIRERERVLNAVAVDGTGTETP